ncbi:MAG: outer membrane protein assembly factor BamD [Halobacteriovoraceae bacterium]|nr:outer membrane protein assembly factor BamD [Halobacteriovoraceae bacterium]
MKTLINLLIFLATALFLQGCDFIAEIEQKAETINRYEIVALNLAKENRELKAEINQLKYEIQTLKAQSGFQKIQLEKFKKSESNLRNLASVPKLDPKNDLVKFGTYVWNEEELLVLAKSEMLKKNYPKAAQLYYTFIHQYPKSKSIDDELYFQAGISAYEAGNYNQWTVMAMDTIINKYPNSKYYRGAKLWKGLAQLKMGKDKDFFKVVEEFRKKYRNTSEWKILSLHYEEIVHKYKQ